MLYILSLYHTPNHRWSKNFDKRLLKGHITGGALPNCPLPWGIQAPTYCMVPRAHPSPHLKRHLDRFSHFCRALTVVSSGQTHRHRSMNIGNNKLHLAMQCSLIQQEQQQQQQPLPLPLPLSLLHQLFMKPVIPEK